MFVKNFTRKGTYQNLLGIPDEELKGEKNEEIKTRTS
jgi:hypothetical protein